MSQDVIEILTMTLDLGDFGYFDESIVSVRMRKDEPHYEPQILGYVGIDVLLERGLKKRSLLEFYDEANEKVKAKFNEHVLDAYLRNEEMARDGR